MSDLTVLAERLKDLRGTRADWPPWPTDKVLARMVDGADEPRLLEIARLFTERERVIRLAKENPFEHGFEWECWERADLALPVLPWEDASKSRGMVDLLTDIRLVVVLGGNRASKSEWAIKRSMQFLRRFPNTRLVFLSQKLETSVQVQQSYAWRYMPQSLKRLNGKKDPRHVFAIKYHKGSGFSCDKSSKFVLPNGSEGVFLVYTQDSDDYEGIQVGCPDQPGVPGWYADESLPLDWYKLMMTRSATMDAVGLWTFTALKGMTQSLKEAIGHGKVLESALEPALAERQCVPGLPMGHCPTVQEGSDKRIRVIYFHTRENPLGGYARVRANLENKPWYMKERGLCGFTKDTRGRLFSTFGSWNVVAQADVPRKGTVYMHVDPHSARNWYMLWVLVDEAGRVWAFDEWPPEEHYGEWAVATERNPSDDAGGGWDGDTGPAQDPVGWGIVQYKQEMVRREKAAERSEPLRRTIDRRAGPAPVTLGTGPSTCLWQELNDDQREADGTRLADGLAFDLAGGVQVEQDGVEIIRQALWVDLDKAIDPLTNFPKLFVSSRCKQLLWALENFTGRDGQKGACKDPIDALRDMYLSGLESWQGTSLGFLKQGN